MAGSPACPGELYHGRQAEDLRAPDGHEFAAFVIPAELGRRIRALPAEPRELVVARTIGVLRAMTEELAP